MKKNEGFTLIEMLVVIAIIGLLSSVVIVGVGGARSKARDARRTADLQQIQNSLELAYDPATGYPSSIPSGAPTEDPQGNPYKYSTATTTLGYNLGICLENAEGGDNSGCPSTLNCDQGKYRCFSQ